MPDVPPDVPPARTSMTLSPEHFARWYGTWDPLTPSTIGAFMEGFDRPWWVIGGWSLEAFTGVHRDHEDMDISMLSSDADAFRLFLGERWTLWNVDDGWFRPFDDRFPDVRQDSQIWVRRDARSPWILDVPLTPDTDGRWTNKRHRAHTEDLADVTWVATDGIRYAKPEVSLMFKAAQAREKDRIDAEVVLPLLDPHAREWLSVTVARVDPHHPWVLD